MADIDSGQGVMRRRTAGFTLAELLVAMAIMSVLAAIAVPVILSQDERAQRAVLQTNLNDAYMLLSATAYAGDAIPTELPADSLTMWGDGASFQPNYTLTVYGVDPETLCVQGSLPSGLTMMGDAAGIRDGSCVAPFTYPTTTFTAGTDEEALSPTVDPNLGDPTFTVESTDGDGNVVAIAVAGLGGVLPVAAGPKSPRMPQNVKFDPATGAFVGPGRSNWTFQGYRVSSGGDHTCALTTAGLVKCWGAGGKGQLGAGGAQDASTPTDVDGIVGTTVAIASGTNHTCALTAVGAVYCWGENKDGQLGTGNRAGKTTATPVQGFATGGAKAVAAGTNNTCIVTDTDELMCFGDNSSGQLGNGSRLDSTTPVTVPGLNDIVSVVLGDNFTCATDASDVWCFGAGSSGQLGNGAFAESRTPVQVSGTPATVRSLTAGANHACFLSAGDVYCWGSNAEGQLGVAGGNSSTPVIVPNLVADSVDAGGFSTCAEPADGSDPVCWGDNSNGQIGVAAAGAGTVAPAAVSTRSKTRQVSVGGKHSCAVLDDGAIECWGSTARGQLGGDVNAQPDQVVSVPATPYCETGTLDPATNECVSETPVPASYTCPNGGTLNGTTCETQTWVPQTTIYSCPNGGSLNGSTCTVTNYSYSCPNGGTRNGSTCTVTSTFYTCPNGGTLNGSTCTRQDLTGYFCDTSSSNVNGDLVEGPDANNQCRWYAWVCPSGWDKVTGSLCRSTNGPFTTSTTCSTTNANLGNTADGYPRYAGGSWTAARSGAPYSCPSGYSLSGTTCSKTTTSTSTATLGPANRLSRVPYCGTLGSGWSGAGSFSSGGKYYRNCRKTTTSTSTRAATPTNYAGFCTYNTYSYAHNATKVYRQGFAATPSYSTTTYSATLGSTTSTYNATLNTNTSTYAATASLSGGYYAPSSYSATYTAPYVQESRVPALWTEEKTFTPDAVAVTDSGPQPGFPAELVVTATYPNGQQYSQTVTLNVWYPLGG